MLAWWLSNILIGLLACWVLLSGFCFASTLGWSVCWLVGFWMLVSAHCFGICSCLATALELRAALRLWVLIGLMAYWFGRFSLFGFCFLNSSAEMCAGSLALVVGSLAFLQPDLRFMVPMGVIWHGRCLYFGVLGDPGTILGH